MTQQEAELAIRASSIQNAYCTSVGCEEPATHQDPLTLCDEHFDEWELHDAEWAAEQATARLERVKKSQRKMRIGNDMTERIKDFYERLKR